MLPQAVPGQPMQQTAATAQPMAKTYAPVPSPMHRDGITYLVGGVGIDSREFMERMAHEYNTQLAFAANPDGHYVVKVHLTLIDAAGRTQFELADAGPVFYAKMPPGRYEVIASYLGEEKRRRIDVGAQGRPVREGFRW
jgi:hypothetical protein